MVNLPTGTESTLSGFISSLITNERIKSSSKSGTTRTAPPRRKNIKKAVVKEVFLMGLYPVSGGWNILKGICSVRPIHIKKTIIPVMQAIGENENFISL